MQALSHYSYHVSSGQFVLCDLQGGIYSDGAIITDPVIISRSAGTYGPTDLGAGWHSELFWPPRLQKVLPLDLDEASGYPQDVCAQG